MWHKLAHQIAIVFFISGCSGVADYMKFPPGYQLVWSKSLTTLGEMSTDYNACYGKAKKAGVYGNERMHYVENCMLKLGYKFTNYRSSQTANYCSGDWYGGGPACKSLGQ